MTTLRQLTFTLLALLLTLSARADEQQPDTFFQHINKEYLRLYGEEDQEQAFFDISQQMLDYCRKNGKTDAYYRIRMNEVLYDTEHNQPYRAIKRANKMLEEMKAERVQQYDVVYLALGTIFESRGNYRMADHYYQEAYQHINKNDEKAQINVYSRLAFLKMFREPEEAEKWNEKNRELSLGYPLYHQVYLSVKSIINFSKGDKEAFLKTEQEYYDYRKDHPELDDYGLYTMRIIHDFYSGKTQQALDELSKGSNDLNVVDRYDMTLRILQMTGQKDQALEVYRQRANAVDSLNSNLLFDNLNEINVEMGVAKMKHDAAEARIRNFWIITALLSIIIVFLIIWLFARRKAKKILIEKNRQLKTALDMAEESDKMKASFIRNVTHEIRTPLNAINGFTQLLNNPDFELDDEERTTMTETIKKNVEDITDIVDELLAVAAKESNDLFPKDDIVCCKRLLQEMVEKFEGETLGPVKMGYTSEVGPNFTIRTNESGLRRILGHLLDNATKFTHSGMITLACTLNAEHRRIVFSVTDTGIGIDRLTQDKIFEQFFKVDQFTQGIGLGLSVSKMIAQKMGGDLTLDSTYTEGSRFVLALPME